MKKRNKTTKNGVRFVVRPPDLTKEPGLEAFNTNKDKTGESTKPVDSIRAIIRKRGKGMLARVKLFWEKLLQYHEWGTSSAKVCVVLPALRRAV